MDSIAWQKHSWETIWHLFVAGHKQVTLCVRQGSLIFSTEHPDATDPTYVVHFHRVEVFPVIHAPFRRLLETRINSRINTSDLYELPPKPRKELPACPQNEDPKSI